VGPRFDILEACLPRSRLVKSDWTDCRWWLRCFRWRYVIGTITYVVLRLFFRPLHGRGYRFHEVALSKGAFQAIWDKLGAPGEADREWELFAGVAFDHGLVRKNYEGIHEWGAMRDWFLVLAPIGVIANFLAYPDQFSAFMAWFGPSRR